MSVGESGTRPPLGVPAELTFDERGLLPVIVQDADSGDVLMLAWANAEALKKSVETGLMHFWSRSREQLWQKGESSGHLLHLLELRADCDSDTLLALVRPAGPSCHTGQRTCFGEDSAAAAGVLEELSRIVEARARDNPAGSYTTQLLRGGLHAALAKIDEESSEVVEAATAESGVRLAEETADLLYHLIVLLYQRGLTPAAALEVLRARRR